MPTQVFRAKNRASLDGALTDHIAGKQRDRTSGTRPGMPAVMAKDDEEAEVYDLPVVLA